ncbi:formin binding protein 3 [Theileria orientalis]|uniref:Formin binding protein 3 n=1 Tax=Theileria orientalis TaxID=68886 RepID=A0A976MB94_THEOR|nr:formin binding protein 3 [Theileria orientalis]
MKMDPNKIWSEHVSKDGRKYYYNQLTKKSQWYKPDELKTQQELLIEAKTKWRSFATAQGKIFYYNTETKESVWEIPEEIKSLMTEDDNLDNNVHDNTKAAFLSFLEGFNFSQKTTWDTALKLMENDPKWPVFSILSKGDKKQLFSEFTSQIHRRKQEEMRRKRTMVHSIIETQLGNWEELDCSTTYAEFAKRYHTYEWWNWVDEETRDNIFQDYIEANESRLKRRKKEHKVAAMDSLIDVMIRDYRLELLPWDRARSKYRGYLDLNDIDVLNCHKYVFKQVYEDRYKEVERASYRLQRKLRARFLNFLKEAVKRGEINSQTKFSDFIANHSKEAVYVDLVGQPGSAPIDLFAEVQNSLSAN